MNTHNIIGQSRLVGRMDRILSDGRIVHAYLFTGPAGSGKKALSSLFAQALICEGPGERPCGVCSTCRQFQTGNHPDVMWIRRQEGRKNILIEQIRDMQEKMKVKPFQAGSRICFIESAQVMTEQAQNALLKTLEEPPSHSVFFLLADNTFSILPTIRSRCQMVRIGSLPREDVAGILTERLNLPREKARTYAALSQGIPGKALSLAEDASFRDNRKRLVEGLSMAGSSRILELYDVFQDHREQVDDLLDILILWFRDLLVYKETGDPDRIINLDQTDLLRKQASLFTIRDLNDMMEKVEASRKILKGNGNYQLTIENMLLHFQGGSHHAANRRSPV